MTHQQFMKDLNSLLPRTEIGLLYGQIHGEGHLAQHQVQAALRMLQDIRLAANKSQHTTQDYDRLSISRAPSGSRTSSDGLSNLERMSKNLRSHEREAIIRMMSVTGNKGCVKEIATSKRYTDRKSRKAYAVAEVAMILSSISEAYGIEITK